MGLRKFRGYLDNFIQNARLYNRTILTNLANSSKPMNLSKQYIDILDSLNSKIPNDDTTQLTLSYQNPLLSTIGNSF